MEMEEDLGEYSWKINALWVSNKSHLTKGAGWRFIPAISCCIHSTHFAFIAFSSNFFFTIWQLAVFKNLYLLYDLWLENCLHIRSWMGFSRFFPYVHLPSHKKCFGSSHFTCICAALSNPQVQTTTQLFWTSSCDFIMRTISEATMPHCYCHKNTKPYSYVS